MLDKRLAAQYAEHVVRARQSGDVNSERRAFASLAAPCREMGAPVDTLLADRQWHREERPDLAVRRLESVFEQLHWF